jgi:hypothetical protein
MRGLAAPEEAGLVRGLQGTLQGVSAVVGVTSYEMV